MSRLRARHRTEIRYAGAVGESVNTAWLTPVAGPRQSVEKSEIRVTPGAEVVYHDDCYGNRVAWFQIEIPHETLIVEAESVVTVRPPAVRGESPDAWELIAADAYQDEHAEFLLPSTYVRWSAPVVGLAQELDLERAREDGPVAWLRAVESGVAAAIVYARGMTAVDTPVEDVVRNRHGVCQDMAHLAIALCRRGGVAARYVSGWLHQAGRSDPGESHAWLEGYVPGAGWVEIDPTHPRTRFDDHVRIAVGRDYSDIPPLRGSYFGAPTTSVDVDVDVALVD